MYTNRDIVSQIRSMSKLLSADQQITDRAILHEAKDVANMIIKQTLDKRKLWSSPNVFASIPCLEMKKAPLAECCEYTSGTQVAKSVKKLPKIGEGIWGLAIQGVFGLDNMKRFKEVTPSRYANLMKLGLPTHDTYYWVLNDYLYVSNPNTAAVNMFTYFTDIIPNDLLYPGEDCDCQPKPSIASLCANPLDQSFYFPADRLDDLKKVVYQNLLRTYFQLASERTSDNNDETSK